MRVLEYRFKARLARGRASLGAALTAAGFATSCSDDGGPAYGAPCAPPACTVPGGSGGGSSTGAPGGTSDQNAAGAAGSHGGAGGTPDDEG